MAVRRISAATSNSSAKRQPNPQELAGRVHFTSACSAAPVARGVRARSPWPRPARSNRRRLLRLQWRGRESRSARAIRSSSRRQRTSRRQDGRVTALTRRPLANYERSWRRNAIRFGIPAGRGTLGIQRDERPFGWDNDLPEYVVDIRSFGCRACIHEREEKRERNTRPRKPRLTARVPLTETLPRPP